MRSLTTMILCGLALATGGCKARTGDDSELRWGFLKDDSLLAGGPQFLINKQPTDTYKVCVARYFANALPGFDAEVQAAAGLWGSYIGRKIPVTTTVVDLPPAGPQDTVETLAAKYAAACGTTYDTVLGLGPLTGQAVGLTGASYQFFANPDGTPHVVAFSRFLFLRDFIAAPAPQTQVQGWISLQQAFGQTPSAPDLLTQMLARSRVAFADSKFLALPVLTHEFGHVWGLCDQYEGSTNCDERHSTSHLVLDSMMGAANARQRLYLTDDDITGIRTLAARPEVAGAWHTDPLVLAAAPAPIVLADLEIAKIRSVTANGSHLLVNYAVVSNKAGRVAFAVRAPGDDAFSPLGSDFPGNPTINRPVSSLDITLPQAGDGFSVQMSVILKAADGSDAPPVVTVATAAASAPATATGAAAAPGTGTDAAP